MSINQFPYGDPPIDKDYYSSREAIKQFKNHDTIVPFDQKNMRFIRHLEGKNWYMYLGGKDLLPTKDRMPPKIIPEYVPAKGSKVRYYYANNKTKDEVIGIGLEEPRRKRESTMQSFKSFVNEGKRGPNAPRDKKYTFQQASDEVHGRSLEWHKGSDGRTYWLDTETGELLPTKEKSPPKGTTVHKDDGKWNQKRVKSRLKKKYNREEANPTNTGNVVGAGDDVADWKNPKKKRKHKVLTRNYIEVMGKRKRLSK